jgi:hypothetical protein
MKKIKIQEITFISKGLDKGGNKKDFTTGCKWRSLSTLAYMLGK